MHALFILDTYHALGCYIGLRRIVLGSLDVGCPGAIVKSSHEEPQHFQEHSYYTVR